MRVCSDFSKDDELLKDNTENETSKEGLQARVSG